MTKLNILTIQNSDKCVILLHGLGSNKYDFEPIAKIIQSKKKIKFVLPQADSIPISINNNLKMPGWYNIESLEDPSKINFQQLDKASNYLLELFKQEQKYFKAEDIYLGGFSQGGAVVLDALLKKINEKIAGVLLLSTYSPTLTQNFNLQKIFKTQKIFIAHGKNDQILHLDLYQEVLTFLNKNKMEVENSLYNMGHEVIEQEIIDILNFL